MSAKPDRENEKGSRIQRWTMAALVGMVAVLGLALGFWWGQQSHSDATVVAPQTTLPAEREVLYWYDPMVPTQHFDEPGKSPFMDMLLVPRYANGVDAAGISIAPGTLQNLGIRTVEVERGRLANTLTAPGTIAWDLRQEHVVSARVDAVIERLFVKAPYTPVTVGVPLVSIRAPAWSTALAATRALDHASSSSAQALQSAARKRLRVLGVPPGTTMRNGRIVLTSPVAGVVSEIGVREGQAVPAGTLLFRINGTDTVWLNASVPQAAVGDIVPGTPVTARVSTLPGRVFTGRVETLLPQIDAGSRTQPARIVLDNPGGALVPGMFAQVTLQPTASPDQLLVPADAVIGAGRETRVIVMGEDGAFRPVAVRIGHSSGGFTEILSGLQGGERVVASGQFLIDSEANLSGALERLGGGRPDKGASVGEADTMSAESTHHGIGTTPGMNADHGASMPTSSAATPSKPGREVLYWYDPMVPDKHFDKPGKSPFMDMPLVPRYADEAATGKP